MSWLSGLSATASASSRAISRTAGLGHVAEREAQIIELVARRREQEIALVARRIGRAVQLGAMSAGHAAHIMAGGEAIGAEVAREAQQIGELHPLVAADAGDRRAPPRIFVGEARRSRCRGTGSHSRRRNGRCRAARRPPWRRKCPGPRSRSSSAPDRLAMVVELERHPDHLGAAAGGERGHDRAVDAARHGDDDPGLPGGPVELEIRVCMIGPR